MEQLKINPELAATLLVRFIREYPRKHGFRKAVLGLSGGLDSTVAAYLAVQALGKENVIGVFLPHKLSHPDSLKDAQKIAGKLQIPTRLVDITPFVDPFCRAFPGMNPVQTGNVMARCRMIALYQISAEEKALVMGTSNKSELLLGYGTLYGDLACAFMPLGDLYKTQVRILAEYLEIPEEIRRKVPSADLWVGQSDEEELGISYDEADRLFYYWFDERFTREELIAEGFKPEFVDRVMKRVISQQFKRTLPPVPKLSNRTLGSDFQYPRDWMK